MNILVAALMMIPETPVRVGSKHFTEGYLVAEMMALLVEKNGHEVQRIHGLGGTMVCFEALKNGAIDMYPEYTGTIAQEILKSPRPLSEVEMRGELRRRFGIVMLPSFGFENTYAIALARAQARALGVSRISDLAGHPELRGGLSYEFLRRQDGWPALAAAYGLTQQPAGMEHGLAYDALRAGQIDFTDAYTTDAKIARYDLVVLEDDRGFFPSYRAVPLLREAQQHLRSAFTPVLGTLDEKAMRALNAAVEIDGRRFEEVARSHLAERGLVRDRAGAAPGLAARLARRTAEHLGLTLVALVLAVALAVPLGVVAWRAPAFGHAIVAGAGLLQTIPSIALLALLIPLLGIGRVPAIVALFVYGLLPIVRNTHAGLAGVEPQYRTIALAMGLTSWQRLRFVELPLAFPVVLAGIKTAAIINIGTATLAAFIGAGGLGEPIVTGLALNDSGMILEGALPAAALALATELAFRLLERRATDSFSG
ncbi:MAG: glycine betaine ABC transporter substrate-binding protein [Myxococcota bacterium]